jgi:hypothetical protein
VDHVFAISGANFNLAKVCEVVIISTFGLVQQALVCIQTRSCARQCLLDFVADGPYALVLRVHDCAPDVRINSMRVTAIQAMADVDFKIRLWSAIDTASNFWCAPLQNVMRVWKFFAGLPYTHKSS